MFREGLQKYTVGIPVLVIFALLVLLAPGYLNIGFPESPEIIYLEESSPDSHNQLPDSTVLQRTFYPDRLNLPTMLTRVDDLWFVVDSYNNRVLYSDRLDRHIRDWHILDHRLSRPHTIASNGNLFVVDDTDANAVRVYRRQAQTASSDMSEDAIDNQFRLVQIIQNTGIRPHRVLFDPATEQFLVLAADSQEMFVFDPGRDGLRLQTRVALPSISGMYTRSFRLMGDEMWLLTGAGNISVVSYRDNSFREIRKISVPPEYGSLNDLWFQNGKYYLTATMGKFGRCELGQEGMHCVDAIDQVPGASNPYLFSDLIQCNGRSTVFLGLVGGKDTILSLQFDDEGSISESGMLFENGDPVPLGGIPDCRLRLAGGTS